MRARVLDSRAAVSEPSRPLDDPARLELLRATGLLDAPVDPAMERYTRLAAALLKAPTALLTLVDDRRLFFSGAFGLAEPWATRRETPLSHSLCREVVERRSALLVADVAAERDLAQHGGVRELGIVAYAGVPLLVGPRKDALGVLCTIDGAPHPWTPAEQGLLEDLAACVVSELELRLERRRLSVVEDTYRALLDGSRDGALSVDQGLNVTAINRAWLEHHRSGGGGALEVGRPLLPQLPGELRAPLQGGLERALAGATTTLELPAPSEGRDYRVHLAPIMAGTAVVGATIYVRDVTARLRAEAELREQTETLHAVLEHMGDAVVVTDKTGAPMIVNPAMVRLYSHGIGKRHGGDYSAVYGIYRVDGSELMPYDETPLQRAVRGEAVDNGELLVRNPDHPEGIITSATARPLRAADGSIRGAVSVIRDITAERRTAQALSEHARGMRGAATIDDETGLRNRRGFASLGAQQLVAAERAGTPLVLCRLELLGLPRLAAEAGPAAVEQLLGDIAWLLDEALREDAVLAHFGAGAFALLAQDDLDQAALSARVAERLAHELGPRVSKPTFELVSAGFDPQAPVSIETLLAGVEGTLMARHS